MKHIFTGDFHLTDRPRDEYRWSIFDFLVEQKADVYFILGDLTDAKDHHSEGLVNRIAFELRLLAVLGPVVILTGNHDYTTDTKKAFFRFLNEVDKITFVRVPDLLVFSNIPYMILPHSKNPLEDWADIDFKGKTVLCHQRFEGAEIENGVRLLSGTPTSLFKGAERVISGDVHVPQEIGPVTYVGSPFPIRFGDHFTPRILSLQTIKPATSPIDKLIDKAVGITGGPMLTSIPVPSILRAKVIIKSEDDIKKLGSKIMEGDQLKIVIRGPFDLARFQKLSTDVKETAEKEKALIHSIQFEPMHRVRRNQPSKGELDLKSEETLTRFFSKVGNVAKEVQETAAYLLREVEGENDQTTLP